MAYVHLPDTGGGGYTSFNRYFFAQVGKEGAVLDERFNHGGSLADYVIDHLKRPIMSLLATREGHDAQLEAAVKVVLDELKKNPLPVYRRPAYPDYQKGGDLGRR